MCSGKQIIDGIYKLCYNIRIVCGANGRVAFLSSKATHRHHCGAFFCAAQREGRKERRGSSKAHLAAALPRVPAKQ